MAAGAVRGRATTAVAAAATAAAESGTRVHILCNIISPNLSLSLYAHIDRQTHV